MIIISGRAKSGKTRKLIDFINGSKDKSFVIINRELTPRYFHGKITNTNVVVKSNIQYTRISDLCDRFTEEEADYVAIDFICENQVEELKSLAKGMKAELILLVQEKFI